MDEKIWLKILETQGVATLLICVACAVLWFWVLPEWRRQAAARLELEIKRQADEDAHRDRLVTELHQTRETHRAERDRLHEIHREDTQRQYQLFREMVGGIQGAIESQSREIAKNSALTVASAEVLGASRAKVTQKASMLYGGEATPEPLKAVGA